MITETARGIVPRVIERIDDERRKRALRRLRAGRSVPEIAQELVVLYQKRRAAVGHAFAQDSPWQRELEAGFPFQETPDQLTAIIDVKEDMESAVPMDRLVCGDVGYGKTEIAVRAVLKAVADGRQAAVLVPTTVLAQQHFNTFSERFADPPVRVEMLSRFLTAAQQREVAAGVAAGRVDVVVGTHRLLSGSVQYKDLGLVIIDEEQRFGVSHKDRLKRLRLEVDVLTLSATPIPRTLAMTAYADLDTSVIDELPPGRTPVTTVAIPDTRRTDIIDRVRHA